MLYDKQSTYFLTINNFIFMKTTIKIFSFLLVFSVLTSCDGLLDSLGLGKASVEMSYSGDSSGKYKSLDLVSTVVKSSGIITISTASASTSGSAASFIINIPADVAKGTYDIAAIKSQRNTSFSFGEASKSGEDAKAYTINSQVGTDFSYTVTKNEGGEITGTFKGKMIGASNDDKAVEITVTNGKFNAKYEEE